MSIEIVDYINVEEQAAKLGCRVPRNLSILPKNFDSAISKDELLYADSAIDIRKLWRQENIEELRIEKDGDKFLYAGEKNSEWIGPTIYIGVALWSQNPYAVSVALNVISTYLTDFFKGMTKNATAKLDIVVEKSRVQKYVRIRYEGTADGVSELDKIVREVAEID